jgi:tetratricopeptide (TPR) repeat protein
MEKTIRELVSVDSVFEERTTTGRIPGIWQDIAFKGSGGEKMGFRFYKRVKLFPGVTLNLSKSGGSLSFGPRGAKLTVGSSGARGSVGLPGSGAYYTKQIWRPGSGSKRKKSQPSVRKEDRLDLNFFERLITPEGEEDFVDGLKALLLGDEIKALNLFLEAAKHPDAAFMAGFIFLRQKKLEESIQHLDFAAKGHKRLGEYFQKYQTDPHITIDINEEFSVHAGPTLRAVRLGMVEAYEQLEQLEKARGVLEDLLKSNPEDAIAKVSLVEILYDHADDANENLKQVIRLTQGTENESEPEACLLLYQARAWRGLGVPEEAQNALSKAIRRTKDRSDELIKAIRYERVLLFEELEDEKAAKREAARLFAMDADYEDIADRL